MKYKFTFEGKEYTLNEEKLDYFVNDEENPIKDIDLNKILEIMTNSNEVDFAKEYFDMPCAECKNGVSEKQKFFGFLGYNFYIYTKNTEFVISSIDKEYEGLSFNRLQRLGKVDNSYIVLVNVCKHCGSYSVEIEEFEI
ncbi:MAG: DUF3785 domain-containing protein [Clostridium sp.]|nr:DUF3785 domain-containing protein [Clostridium sp.]